MNISRLLHKEGIKLKLGGTNKKEILDELIELHCSLGNVSDREVFTTSILDREKLFSTGLEHGVALPHAKCDAVEELSLVMGISPDGIDFESHDGVPSNIFFMIAAPKESIRDHIKTISRLTTFLLEEDFRKKLLECTTENEILDIIEEREMDYVCRKKKKKIVGAEILAVTACPTGIAHTYMAAEALSKKAEELKIKLKVETNGSSGVMNALTDEDIKRAKCIIIASDKAVEMGRFNGKNIIEVPVADGIKIPEKLIKDALAGKGTICEASQTTPSNKKVRTGVYKHLMNGVSNMLPFVVGGGILIAISFMFGIKAFDINDPTYNPIAKFLMDIGGGTGAFGLMVPILAGFIGMSIADKPGFMPAMIGGFMAMTSGAGFLGGMLAGFVGGYSSNFIKRITSNLPKNLDGIKVILVYPVLGLLLTGILMKLLLVPVSHLNVIIINLLENLSGSNLILLGIILGGMMAVDMGGPINKAAFTFGLAAIAAGDFHPHAAVMAGGMVPPLGIALATTFFKNLFSKEDREAGVTNYVLGASFITEGAIPFAAKDPTVIIPSCIIGSAVAGGLTMYFNCTLPAPHGGIFVIPLVNNPILYLVSILLGAITTALFIVIFKKKSKV